MSDHSLIDIHAHILPGWDDGLPSLEGAVSIAGVAARQGVRAIIATPRLRDHADAFDRAMAVRESVWWLQDALDDAGIPVTVFPGAQLLMGRYLPDALKRRAPVTLAASGKYVLVDLSDDGIEGGLRLLEAVLAAGVTPVLAHPERVPAFQREPQALRPVVERGALVQINSGSLLCDDAPAECDAATAFLALRLVHFIASDTHANAGPAGSLLQAVEAAARIMGEEEALRLVCANPDCILQGEPLHTGPGAADALTLSKP